MTVPTVKSERGETDLWENIISKEVSDGEHQSSMDCAEVVLQSVALVDFIRL